MIEGFRMAHRPVTHNGPVRSELGGWEQLLTQDGEVVRVEVIADSAGEIAVVVDAPNGEALARTAIPYPWHGYGGHELLLSAKERYLAMFLYSGQSEVGYELFCFRPRLQHVCSFGYVFGEGFGPAFSSDERWIGLAWATNPTIDLDDEGLGGKDSTTAESVVDWAQLRIQELPDGPATTCNIQLRVGSGFPLESNDSFYPEHLEIAGSGEACFHTAWGEQVRTSWPLPSVLVIPGPRDR
jgi:hypothetical protein